MTSTPLPPPAVVAPPSLPEGGYPQPLVSLRRGLPPPQHVHVGLLGGEETPAPTHPYLSGVERRRRAALTAAGLAACGASTRIAGPRVTPTRLMHLRPVDVLHLHVYGLGALSRLLRAALLSPATLVVHLHESSTRPVLDGRPATLRDRLLGAPLEHVLVQRARLVVAPTRATAELADELGARQVVAPVPAVLPSSANLKSAPARPDPHLPGRRVVSVGPLATSRRLRELVEVMAAQPLDTHLVLLGTGPEEEQLRRLADGLALSDRLHVRHHPTYADVDAHLRHADVVATTSVAGEGPFALLRAMQLGRPVVAVDADDRRRIISPDVDGVLVPIGHRWSLAGALRKVLTDAPLAESLGAAAARRVAARGWSDVGAEILRALPTTTSSP